MKFIEGLGWVEDDVTAYPNWFQSFVKEKMTDKKIESCDCCKEIKSGLTEEQHRKLNKAMNQDIRRNGRQK